jgi:hypothetical protein
MRTRALRLVVLPLLAAAAAPLAAQAQRAAPAPDSLSVWVDSLRRDPNGVVVAPRSLHMGPYTVAPGERVDGSVVAVRGDLDVEGTVLGNAVAIRGDVILHPGSSVAGDAVAIGGQVRPEGGRVGGEMRSVSAFSTAAAATDAPLSRAQATWRSISLAVGWFTVLAVIGLLTLLLTRSNLETVAERIRDDFSRAFLIGLLGEFALLPGLVLSLVVLAITLIGIVLIPFAIIAYLLAAAGMLALGFIAMAYVSGESVLARRASPYAGRRSAAGYTLLLGLSLYFGLWILGAAFTWAGIVGALLRLAVAAVTWVAVTVGFGATLLSRAGTHSSRGAGLPPLPPLAEEEYSWQTPTPVTGVAAAPRPAAGSTPPEL